MLGGRAPCRFLRTTLGKRPCENPVSPLCDLTRPSERRGSDRGYGGAGHDRMVGMVETVTGSSSSTGLADAARLLHDFNVEYDEPAPSPHELADRLAELVVGDHVTVLLARAPETGAAVGVAVMRVQPSVWSRAMEAYLAELYVVPSRRGQGFGRELITEAVRVARDRGAPTTPSWSRARTTGSRNASTRRRGSAGPRAKAVRSCWRTSGSCSSTRTLSVRRVTERPTDCARGNSSRR